MKRDILTMLFFCVAFAVHAQDFAIIGRVETFLSYVMLHAIYRLNIGGK